MKIGFILDVDREFTSFSERNLTLFGYNVQTFTKPDECWENKKLIPCLVLVRESVEFNLTFISRIRNAFPKAIIIYVAQITESINAKSVKQAGATEFIEKNGATFVRLRTCLDQIEIESKKNSIIGKLKKAFLR
jgi:DNA-binding NtrC family response regulator